MKVSKSIPLSAPRPVAVVTGAAGTIGPAICGKLHAAGWRVAACDLSQSHFQKAQSLAYDDSPFHDGEFYADLTSPSACKQLIEEVNTRLGPVSLIVHGAVDGGLVANLSQISPQQFSKEMALNVGAPLFLTQAALPSLIQTRGSVILISSIRINAFTKDSLLYSTSKAAVEKLTEALAFELSDSGVRVNCIRVGSIPGWDFARQILDQLQPEQRKRICEGALPGLLYGHGETAGVRKRGIPADAAAAVLYLASSDAEFIQGAVLPVDGGFSLRRQSPSHAPAIFEKTREGMRKQIDAQELDDPPCNPAQTGGDQ